MNMNGPQVAPHTCEIAPSSSHTKSTPRVLRNSLSFTPLDLRYVQVQTSIRPTLQSCSCSVWNVRQAIESCASTQIWPRSDRKALRTTLSAHGRNQNLNLRRFFQTGSWPWKTSEMGCRVCRFRRLGQRTGGSRSTSKCTSWNEQPAQEIWRKHTRWTAISVWKLEAQDVLDSDHPCTDLRRLAQHNRAGLNRPFEHDHDCLYEESWPRSYLFLL